MAATASQSPWNPEDDLRLKNAVEAGASLEALAKGAVQFSRRFTVKELQDRWRSLLYDPEISAEASARMVEFELSAPNIASKLNRSGNSKESVEVSAKRKVESVRRLYYAMRKRICGEPFNSTDLSFIGAPNVNGCIGHGGGCQEHMTLDNKPPVGSCMLGGHISNHYGIQETGLNIPHHALPEIRRDVAAANAVSGITNPFLAGLPNSLEDNHPNGIVRKDCFYGFHDDVSSSIKESEKNGERHPIPQTPGDNLVGSGNCSGIEEVGPSRALTDADILKADNLEAKSLSAFDSMNNDLGNVCSGFEGSHRFNSPVSDGSASIHSMGFSSPHPRVPLWRMTEDISAPAMPITVSLRDEGQGEQDTPRLPDDDDCLLQFANEDDLLLMHVDGDDTMDKSCYDNVNSLLLSSPTYSHEDDVPHLSEPKTLVSDTCLAILCNACPAELNVINNPLHTNHGVQHGVCYSEVNVPPSTSVSNPQSPELHGTFMYCTLNSEDPEIPCNDDILFPTAFDSAVTLPLSEEASDPPSIYDNQKDGERFLAQSITGSQMIGPDELPEISPNHPIVGCGFKFEWPYGRCLVGASRHLNNARVEPGQCRSANAAPNSAMDGALKEEAKNAKLEELDPPATFGEYQPLAEPYSFTMAHLEPVVNPSTSDQEEFESDGDVPYFSDIEAMILEMDLCPYDQDSYVSGEVARYQYEDTKRTVVRLEQCARSSLRRAIASQGALAILYGRHMKYYIKKAEVILGRATDDNDVDIDLGREGRANKISRRQASIKMERDGSFFLKNLGKSSISVNGKDVTTGQLLNLSSSCLIEIREMSFVFEVNHKSVRQYLAKKSQENNTNFEWSPEEFHQ
ncbi:hypothetical protein L1049_003491 [Liquidambar formosana]|uniref:FHA domain-containing protein n=1 Tax=Liquidambar formosana TaxID=63359 RepID=A0AAP0N2X4_LIQFO